MDAANLKTKKGVIGILTGCGDGPGGSTSSAKRTMTTANFSKRCRRISSTARAGPAARFLHTSRTNPSKGNKCSVPAHLQSTYNYNNEINDLTAEVLKNLDWLGIDYLIPTGGDAALSYGVRLYQEGVKVVAIPKTMDNDCSRHPLLYWLQHPRDAHHCHDRRPADQRWISRALHGARSIRPVCRIHCPAAHHGRSCEPSRDS